MTTMLLCDECPKTFLNKASLSMHRSYHKSKTFTCLVCWKIFSSRAEFQNHSNSHKEHKCGDCGKTFSHQSSLTIHSRLHKGNFTCPYCNKIFARNKMVPHLAVKFC